ncbi:hypothetical protein [Shewanella algae]|uniref:hypothetical protein n=1 Tax=Shewanella algae TaxID=38313 RepID=UPI0031F4936C
MPFNFSEESEWNLENELRCLLIFKELEESSFPRGLQVDLATKMSSQTNLSVGNISAKVSNYKSEAGINAESNSSEATKVLYQRFGSLSLKEVKALYEGYKLAQEQNA